MRSNLLARVMVGLAIFTLGGCRQSMKTPAVVDLKNNTNAVITPEAGSGTLPPERVRVRLEHVAPERRAIHVDAAEDALLQALTGADPGLRHRD